MRFKHNLLYIKYCLKRQSLSAADHANFWYRRASFRAPWRAPTPDDATLVNPTVGKDGLLIDAFAKGIGLGTCGEASSWAWTGHDFELVRLSEMRECRGVGSDDWPMVYRAFLR